MHRAVPRSFRRALIAAAVLALPAAEAGAAVPNAPLTEPPAALAQALECGAGVGDARRTPVILVHGTGSTPEESYSYGYATALPKLGFPVCTVRLPHRGLADQQRSAQYVVHAVREVSERSGRRVSLIGHSQGGALVAYAPYFWPDLADKVDDVIGLAGAYRGTSQANRNCEDGRCPVTSWHFRLGSPLNRAFLGRPQPAGPSFTSVATANDQLVTPAPEASNLPGARNIVLQDLCPGRPTEHFTIVGDAVAYAMAVDALNHPGPADPARFDPLTCAQTEMPGADVVQTAVVGPVAIANSTVALATAPEVSEPPPLVCPFDAQACPPPRLSLVRRCTGSGLRVQLLGDVHAVRDVNFKLDRRLARRDVAPPFRATISHRRLARADAERLRAVVYLAGPGSERTILARSLPGCRR